MRAIRVVLATTVLITCLHAATVQATAFSTDQSDLWWNPAESGWGIQLVERGSIIFATMFVYAPAGNPVWYTATLNAINSSSWTGDLYATTGTWFGNPTFIPLAPGNLRKVGTMSWSATSVTAGRLAYTVDDVPVTKNLVRQFITYDDFGGTFLGGIHQTVTNCTDPAKNATFEDFATLTVTQSGTSLGFTVSSQLGLACTFGGTLTQDGRFGTSSGTSSCNGDPPTAVTLSAMSVGFNSLYLRYDTPASGNGCVTSGYFSGARHR